jgi:hydrogenase large subunit
MCFKNLPVEFDDQGRAYLKEGLADPYGYDQKPTRGNGHPNEEQIRELLARNGHVQEVNFDPVTRVAGALAFHTVVDLEQAKVLESNSMATLFRGYEVILKGRDPRDAIFISSRACGVCGGVHSVTAALGIEMALGIQPPPLGIALRNMLLATEFLYDHPLHLFLLAGPDYSEQAVRSTNPEVWELATRTPATRASVHGYAHISDVMTDMNPLTGHLYLEAMHITRVAREAYVLIGAKYPHPQTIVPGGLSVTVTLSTFNQFYPRLVQILDYSKKAIAIWDDLTEFFYSANPDYRRVGARPANMVDTGIWDDIDAYDASYEHCNEWGDRRWATPGVLVDGELRTTRLQDINIGLEEFIEHSYYEQWNEVRMPTDPLGAPLSPWHPWNKETMPKPTGQNWKEKYTWDTAPRWDRMAMESGAYDRLWSTALAQKMPENPFIHPTGHSLKMLLPKGERPETEVEWHVPRDWGAFERNRARAYCIAYSGLVALNMWVKGLDLLKQGETAVSTSFEIPRKGRHVGAGFWGAGRGYLTHHTIIEDGALANYQILTPSTWNASPRDPWGNPGPYEEAVFNTPLLETYSESFRPENFKGIDILRTIRSFDPCMPCTTHIHTGHGDIVREVNTCACGVE